MLKRVICAVLCLILAGSAMPVSAQTAVPEGARALTVEVPEGVKIFSNAPKYDGGRYAEPGDELWIYLVFHSPLFELDRWEAEGLELTAEQKTVDSLEFVMPDHPVTLRAVQREVVCPYTDVPRNSWYYEGAAWCHSYDVVRGVSDTLFEPYAPVTRAQFVKMLYRYFEPRRF